MNNDGKLILNLESRTDVDNQVYWICKLKGPFTIDCSGDGVAFLVFTSEAGNECLQISSIIAPKEKDKPKEAK